MLNLLDIAFQSSPVDAVVTVNASPRRGSPRGAPGGWAKAQKLLPIRKEARVDLAGEENPKEGQLDKGDAVWVLERKQVQDGVWRALVAEDSSAAPKGWVTAAKEGMDFLPYENSLHLMANAPQHVRMKFHCFSYQLPSKVRALGAHTPFQDPFHNPFQGASPRSTYPLPRSLA